MKTAQLSWGRAMLAVAASFAMISCGGDSGSPGGGNSGSAPAPTPTPTPPPSGNFDDEEYRRSTWLTVGDALPAFQAGGSGKGAILAIIDNGIWRDDPEFAGRLLDGTNGGSDSGSHGTAVARIAAAARNGDGALGVAFEASILSYNAERCTTGCYYLIEDLAIAVDAAIARGARVINMSIVGDVTRESLFAALKRATDAGVVVVIAAGNGGNADPDPFGLQNATVTGSKLVMLAGAHTADRQLTEFSDRAGAGAEWYIAAYSNGPTSYSAPVVSGTVALIAASFPQLTGEQIVDIIHDSAVDAGQPGRDAVFGNGILDIGAAFELARTRAGA